jgi:protein phosphatase PTC6
MGSSTPRACEWIRHAHRGCTRIDFWRVSQQNTQRLFHDYFVTHLPSSSLHPDSRSAHHQLPRAASKPHTPKSSQDPSPAPVAGVTRDTTVVRIPLRSAKHHFGVSLSRGTRPYNEDTYQAGVIELPAFAKKSPVSLSRAPVSSPLQAYREDQKRQREAQQTQENTQNNDGEGKSAEGASGDPQVFYFGVFDGHGGAECSGFLRERLHEYIEDAAQKFHLSSSLKVPPTRIAGESAITQDRGEQQHSTSTTRPRGGEGGNEVASSTTEVTDTVLKLQKSLINGWRDLVGGYFRRFKPSAFFSSDPPTIFTVLTYAFLRADFDFIAAQARKIYSDADPVQADAPLNASDILDSPSRQIGGPKWFKGGSTCSLALISTPSPTPFWHPASPSTLVVAHVGDTRILLCRTSDGKAVPMTQNHHPSSPVESERLRKYAATFVTDSFGEERMSGLANTRAFGDMQSKRIGVSAEPEIRKVEMAAGEYSFMVLLSDGVTGTLADQEIVDTVKEAKTPEHGARDVVSFATEVSTEGDNATCLVIRLGGWERRSEGGGGSMGTKESRAWKRQEATVPRSRRE